VFPLASVRTGKRTPSTGTMNASFGARATFGFGVGFSADET
jgi:hypothetical protein